MKATADDKCAVCGREYSKGTQVRKDPRDASKLAHVTCGRRVARLRRQLGEK